MRKKSGEVGEGKGPVLWPATSSDGWRGGKNPEGRSENAICVRLCTLGPAWETGGSVWLEHSRPGWHATFGASWQQVCDDESRSSSALFSRQGSIEAEHWEQGKGRVITPVPKMQAINNKLRMLPTRLLNMERPRDQEIYFYLAPAFGYCQLF